MLQSQTYKHGCYNPVRRFGIILYSTPQSKFKSAEISKCILHADFIVDLEKSLITDCEIKVFIDLFEMPSVCLTIHLNTKVECVPGTIPKEITGGTFAHEVFDDGHVRIDGAFTTAMMSNTCSGFREPYVLDIYPKFAPSNRSDSPLRWSEMDVHVVKKS